MRTLTYYVATTLDGFIADPSGGTEFFPTEGDHMFHRIEEYPETLPVHVRDQLEVTAPGKHFDAVVMGRRTWEPSLSVGLTSAYPHLQQYVFSKTLQQAPDDTVTVVATDPLEYVRDLKKQDGRGIWLCGGGTLAGELLSEIDELAVEVTPIITGNGIPLFRTGFEPQFFELAESRVFDSGVVFNRFTTKA